MKKRYFAFLRRLQAKGRSNMYGAVPYLMRTFELGREQAFAVVCEWIDMQALDPPDVQAATPPLMKRHSKRTVATRSKRKRPSRATI